MIDPNHHGDTEISEAVQRRIQHSTIGMTDARRSAAAKVKQLQAASSVMILSLQETVVPSRAYRSGRRLASFSQLLARLMAHPLSAHSAGAGAYKTLRIARRRRTASCDQIDVKDLC